MFIFACAVVVIILGVVFSITAIVIGVDFEEELFPDLDKKEIVLPEEIKENDNK